MTFRAIGYRRLTTSLPRKGNVLPALTACSLHLHVVNTVNAIHIMVNAIVRLGGEGSTV